MINVILEYILLGYIPILFFVAIILRGREKKDDQFYWGSKIQEKSSFANDISIFFLYWNMSLGIILLFTIFFLFLCNVKFVSIDKIGHMLTLNRAQEIIVTDFAAISAYSLVAALKKKFYLGVSIQDVLRNSCLPEKLQYICIDSTIILVAIVANQIEWISEDGKVLLLILVKITYLLWILNLLSLFVNITKLFISTTKSELKSFEALKYRINSCYILDDKKIVDEFQVKAVCEYLLKKIQRKYDNLVKGQNKIQKVELKSVELDKNIWIDLSATICMGVLALLFIAMGWAIQMSGKGTITFIGTVIATVVTVVTLLIGGKTHIWARGIMGRVFYQFEINSRKKIVMTGLNILWKSRYDLIEYIQDLLGLYKVLLDNNIRKNTRNVVVCSVNDYIKSKELKKTLEILLSYFEYDYILKNKKEKLVNKKGLVSYNKKIKKNSVEYMLANAILSELYKETKIENGNKNFEIIENTILNDMVEYLDKTV